MRTMMIAFGRRSRAAAVLLAVALSVTLSACEDYLEVTNPGAIENPTLNNPNYLGLMHDGVMGDFQPAYAWTALFSGAFTDELRMHHTFFENLEIDQRRVTENNGTYALAVFNGLHRARFMADTVAGRYRAILGDTADNDVRYARVLAIGGYAWTLLGEQICETRINAQGAPLTPNELFTAAISRFEDAIAAANQAEVAAANITNATVRARVIAAADSVRNLARVGAARAALDMNNTAAALTYAQAVQPAYVSDADPGFRYDMQYRQGSSSTESRRMGSPFWEFVSAGGSWVSLSGTGYENLNDPRVPHGEPRTAADGGMWLIPNAGRSFSGYDGTPTGRLYVDNGSPGTLSSIRLGSAMEARYIIAEVQGVAGAGNLDFLNDQRAVGGQAALVAPTEAEYQAALREQRAREFFADGHRLGDLRRYEANYGVDLWPTGNMYGGTTTFGTQKCWPTPVSELF